MLSLIMDRTVADVLRVQALLDKIDSAGWDNLSASEKMEWLAGLPYLYDSNVELLLDSSGVEITQLGENGVQRGEYNFTDFNRVGEAVQYLAELLNSYGYAVNVCPKTNWTINDEQAADTMSRYISDLTTLKTAFYGTVILPVSMIDLTAEQANNIEKLLLEIETNINRMLTAFRHSGVAISGLGGLIA